MNALQQFKQKGRILRKVLANAFNTEVKLTLAYEAIAVMEGCVDWNEFSARLANSGAPVKPKAPDTAPAPAPIALPAIRAIFQTVDGKAEAHFDASAWFAQASEGDIRGLMNEKPHMAPTGYELSYGGKNGYSDAVAEFVAPFNEEIRSVYGYIQALSAVGGDCGGSDCYVNAHDVQGWLRARHDVSAGANQAQRPLGSGASVMVLDTHVADPANTALLRKVCQSAWEYCVDDWKQVVSEGKHCQFVIESSNIFAALGDHDVVSTGEDSYDDSIAEVVDRAMQELGYHRLARLLSGGYASLDESLMGVVAFSSLNEGDEFRDVDLGELYRKQSVHRAEIADFRTGEFQGEVKFFDKDFDVHLCKRAPEPEPVYERLQILEVMMQDLVDEYDVPDNVPEWQWVQRNAAFSHRDNGKEDGGGVWEFMVNVDCADNAGMPAALKPLFEKARLHKAVWVMFHQGT